MNIGHDERVIKALKTSLLISFFGGRVVRPDQTQDFYNQPAVFNYQVCFKIKPKLLCRDIAIYSLFI